MPSAWVDPHHPGLSRSVHVYAQVAPRRFEDVSQRYGIDGVAALAVVCEDLNGDGRPDLVVANYREQFEYDTDSYVYWGTGDGFDTTEPLRLPTHYAQTVVAADLDGSVVLSYGFRAVQLRALAAVVRGATRAYGLSPV